MLINPDFRELLSLFNSSGVEYLLVGAYALAVHGHARATKDLDIFVAVSEANAGRIVRALQEFGFANAAEIQADLLSPHNVVRLGRPPRQVDILTSVSGIQFAAAWEQRITVTSEDLVIHVIGRAELIANKRAAGRLQDLADVEALGED